MILQSVGNIAFSFLGYDIYYYGILMAISIISGIFVANFVAVNYFKINKIIYDIAPYIIISGFLGARIYYCLLNYAYYSTNLFDILNFRQGGLSIHGAILGGILYLIYYSQKHNCKFTTLADIFACATPISQAIGRWGNFFNSEAFGLPYDGFCKLYIAPQLRPEKYIDAQFFHPTFLYESLLDLLLFFFLLYIAKYKQLKSGNICLIYLIIYSIIRLFVEQFRIDANIFVFGFSIPTIVSFILIITCSVILLIRRN